MAFTIDETNQTIDLQGLKNYNLNWDKPLKQREVYGFQIWEPDTVPDEDCINYGLPVDDQIFRKTWLPPQMRSPIARLADPNDLWTEEQVDHFVDVEYHRRKNGVWIFIKGEKVWLPGGFYIFLNYWKLLSLVPVKFIYTALELWWIWIDTLRDPNWDGLIDFKCRQIGDTEFVIFMIWEFASRVRGKKCCMQSALGDEHIQKSYDRLVYGAKEMIWFMKPINRGTDSPAEGLEFRYPAEIITAQKLRNNKDINGSNLHSGVNYEHPEINSEILFGPYKERYFDGGTYGRAYFDEFGKAELFDPAKLLRVYQPAINNKIINRQVGKIIATSTVEEMKSGKSLVWSKKLWQQAKPFIGPTGMTSVNRMRRIFRSALDRAPVDRFGHPMKEAERKRIEEQTKAYLESGDLTGMLEHQRANPLTIEEAFKSTTEGSQFDTNKLEARRMYINSDDYTNPRTGSKLKPWVRGNLRWKDDKPETMEVIWEPNSQGHWMISSHPKDFGFKENDFHKGMFKNKPKNTNAFIGAVDPFEQKKTVTDDWSLGGIAVKRRLDTLIDKDNDATRYYQFDDEARHIKAGDPVDGGLHFVTNRYCCVYLHRHADPEDFYDDVVKTFFYYGCQFLPEKNKASGLLKYCDDNDYDGYVVDSLKLTANAKGKSEEGGVTATEGSINEYFGYLTTLSCKWANTIDLPWILDQLLSMNWDNRGQKDLGVAVGWCEYACKLPVHYKKRTQEQKESTYFEEQIV